MRGTVDLSTYVVSVLRTTVPAGIGAALAWLASLGIDAGPDASAGLTMGGTAMAIVVYYAAVRAIEPRLPAWLRVVLLGAARTPSYGIAASPPTVARSRRPGRPGAAGGAF